MKAHNFVFIIVVLLATSNVALGDEKAKVTFKAIDEGGQPLANITVDARFLYGTERKGITDTNGLFVLDGTADGWDTWYSFQNDGYYPSCGKYMLSAPQKGKWQPWNPVITSVVRRIVNPIPMYAKHVETMINDTNQWFGFDLEAGAWTKPVGNGSVSDIVFRVEGYWKNYRENDSVMTLSFSRPSDGICADSFAWKGSAFAMTRVAPLDTYQNIIKWRKARFAREGQGNDMIYDDLKNSAGFIFQVRSKTNEAGVVTSACYGKIHASLKFGGAGTNGCYLNFTYYFNPTPNDRNLEFDPQKNLLNDLKSTELVGYP